MWNVKDQQLAEENQLKSQDGLESDELETQEPDKKAEDVEDDCSQHGVTDGLVSCSVLSDFESVVVAFELEVESLSFVLVLSLFVIEWELTLQAFNIKVEVELNDHLIVCINFK